MKKPTLLGHCPCAGNVRKRKKKTSCERLVKQKSIQKNGEQKKKKIKSDLN